MNGLFVVGESNARGLPVPHLPRISRSVNDALVFGTTTGAADSSECIAESSCPDFFDCFVDGDVVRIDARRGRIRSILSKGANANTLLLTEQCDNRCLFCSQPPNLLDDTELYNSAALAILNFNSRDIIGLSGGEPTHNERAFFLLLDTLNCFDNKTPLHILTNGRRFSDAAFTRAIASRVKSRDVLWGIPLYGHRASLHDHLVGAHGAFSETIEGLLHLSSAGEAIELRIIPVQQNVAQLGNIMHFLATNSDAVRLVSIMHLEPKGWARKNYASLYVPAKEQVPSLEDAVCVARTYGIDVRLFNYPLCLLSERLRAFAVPSISDWKNYYPRECDGCAARTRCGGFFASATGPYIERVEPMQ